MSQKPTPIGLTSEQLRLLLNSLDGLPRDPNATKRKARRLPFRSLNVFVEVLDGQRRVQNSFHVATRNISASGLGFLHKHAMSPGQTLRLEIPTFDDQSLRLLAEVTRCRYVERMVHEIGAKFVGRVENTVRSRIAKSHGAAARR